MIKQTQLRFKVGLAKEEITPRAGLSVYSEFLRGFGIKDLIDTHMPLPAERGRLNRLLACGQCSKRATINIP